MSEGGGHTHISVESGDGPFVYLATYGVLICREHAYAIQPGRKAVGRHLEDRHRSMSIAERKRLTTSYDSLDIYPPSAVPQPPPLGPHFPELGMPLHALLCLKESCGFITVNRTEMLKHWNKQHGTRLSRWSSVTHMSYSDHADQLFCHVLAQTFFATRRYVRYFTVQLRSDPYEGSSIARQPTPQDARTRVDNAAQSPINESDSDSGGHEEHARRRNSDSSWFGSYTGDDSEQGDSDHRNSDREDDRGRHSVRERVSVAAYRMTQVSAGVVQLSDTWERLHQQDRDDMQRMAESTAPKDRTGWFKRTQWDEHLQAYPDRRLLSYASRLPDHTEPQLQRAVKIVEQAIDTSVRGLSTLSIETRRWLKSPKPKDPDVRPLGPFQCRATQTRAAKVWARVICYCLRLVAAEEGEDDQQPDGSTARTSDASLDAPSLITLSRQFPWSGRQKQATKRLWQRLSYEDAIELEDPSVIEGQIKYVMRLSGELICQKVYHRPFSSGLIHFLAVLGINPEQNRLRTAPEFSSTLSAILYCIRVLIVETFLPSAQRETQAKAETELFLARRTEYLVDGSYSVVSTILSLLSYAKVISMTTPSASASSMWWSLDKRTFYHKGRPVQLERFRQMAQGFVDEAERVLWTELLWCRTIDERFTIDLESIRDDITFARRGGSALDNELLKTSKEWLLKRLASTPAAQRLFRRRPSSTVVREEDTDQNPAQLNWQHVRQYLGHTDRFLDFLLLAIHVTGGQPARGPEILSVRWRNSILQDRNIYIMDGQVAVITRYHKTQSQWDRPKVILRFLPDRLGQILIVYLLYVRHFRTVLLNGLGRHMTVSANDFLWASERGPWDSSRLSRTMSLESAERLSVRLTLQDYRHVAIGIGRAVIGKRFAAGDRTERGLLKARGSEGEESDSQEDESLEDPLELQSGHSTATGNIAYAVRADMVQGVSARSIESFRRLSRDWHKFLGLDQVNDSHDQRPPEAVESPTTRTSEDTGNTTDKRKRRRKTVQGGITAPYEQSSESLHSLRRTSKRRKVVDTRVLEPDLSTPDVEPPRLDMRVIRCAVRTVLGLSRSDTISYTSRQQQEALMAVVRGVSPLIVVLPTGAGKSLLFMAPALTDTPDGWGRLGVTILIVPSRALIQDTIVRLANIGIASTEWLPNAESTYDNHKEAARIVVVSADLVGGGKGEFITYAALLARSGILRRIVVDEAHIPITAAHWRRKLALIWHIRLIKCQLVFLTATLPPALEVRLRSDMLVQKAVTIRTPTTQRANIQYSVVRSRPGNTLSDVAVHIIQRKMTSLVSSTPDLRTEKVISAKIIIYCRDKPGCESLAAKLGCPFYHADVPSRAAVLDTWRTTGGCLVSTSATGVGLDVPGIAFVLHIGLPWGLIDFVQESGRAGRNVREGVAESVILLDRQPSLAPLNKGQEEHENESDGDDNTAMIAFVRTRRCRRVIMGGYMDGRRVCCHYFVNQRSNAVCDNCHAGEDCGYSVNVGHIHDAPRTEGEANDDNGDDDSCRDGGGPRTSPVSVDEDGSDVGVDVDISSCVEEWQDRVSNLATEERIVRERLTELAESDCPYCWGFAQGMGITLDLQHSLQACSRLHERKGQEHIDMLRKRVRYRTDVHTCMRCGISQHLCTTGEDINSACQWPHVLMPVVRGLLDALQERFSERVDGGLRVGTVLSKCGYSGQVSIESADLTRWLGQRSVRGLVFSHAVSNAMAVLVEMIKEEWRF